MPYRVARRGLLALGASLGCAPLLAQDAYPSRRIEIIVPFGAGTTTDIVGRAFAEALARPLGQQVVVENRAGAGGALAAEASTVSDPVPVSTFSISEKVRSAAASASRIVRVCRASSVTFSTARICSMPKS